MNGAVDCLFLSEFFKFLGVKRSDKLVFWQAYLDDSGTHSDSDQVVVGSVLGKGEVWKKVCEAWGGVLKKHKLPYYHATEFKRSDGVARHLSKVEKDDCMSQLIQVISDVDLEYIVYSVERDKYETAIQRYPALDLSIYDYLLASSIGDIHIRVSAIESQSQQPLRVFVSIEAGCPLSTDLCSRLMKSAGQGRIPPICSIVYLPKQANIPLQIADLIAHSAYKSVLAKTADSSRRVVCVKESKAFSKIVSGNPYRIFVIDSDWLSKDLPVAQKFLDGVG